MGPMTRLGSDRRHALGKGATVFLLAGQFIVLLGVEVGIWQGVLWGTVAIALFFGACSMINARWLHLFRQPHASG